SHFHLKSLSLGMPIADNLSFIPSTLDTTIRLWRQTGLCTISDLYQKWSLLLSTRNQTHTSYTHRSDFFRYTILPKVLGLTTRSMGPVTSMVAGVAKLDLPAES
ncbi:hypothetical protein ATANTOWER_028858, partial [Ataeniobius toweri]|nr:hypothetical protein [Ataeniobius toweri]